MTRGSISVGDVVRAFGALAPASAEERRRIARVLGFDLLEAPAPPPVLPDPPPAVTAGPAVQHLVDESTEEVTALPPMDPPADQVVLMPLHPARGPVYTPEGDALEAPAEEAPPLRMPSLFVPDWRPAITRMLAAVRAPQGEIDVDALVDRLGSGRPIASLPRQARLTTGRGLTLVLDVSEPMRWLHHDQRSLVEDLEHLLEERLAVRRVALGARRLPGAPRLDERGRLLAVTDFGLGGPWQPDQPEIGRWWLRLAARARARGQEVAALVPCALDDVPGPWRRAFRCFAWDASTRPSALRAAIWSERP